MSTVALTGNDWLKQEVVVLWSPILLSPHTNVARHPLCAFINVRTHAYWPPFDFRYSLSFKWQKIPDDLAMITYNLLIGYKPRLGGRGIEERSKTP